MVCNSEFYCNCSLGYGFAMGQLFYIRELAPNGPALATGEIQAGDRVIEVNSILSIKDGPVLFTNHAFSRRADTWSIIKAASQLY